MRAKNSAPSLRSLGPAQPNTAPHVREDSKATEKKKRLIPTRNYKVKVVASLNIQQYATMQPPLTNPKAPVNSEGQKALHQKVLQRATSLPIENIPVHTSTPWPEARKMSENLFELMKDWPIPPTNNTLTATSSKPPIKIEAPSTRTTKPQ